MGRCYLLRDLDRELHGSIADCKRIIMIVVAPCPGHGIRIVICISQMLGVIVQLDVRQIAESEKSVRVRVREERPVCKCTGEVQRVAGEVVEEIAGQTASGVELPLLSFCEYR